MLLLGRGQRCLTACPTGAAPPAAEWDPTLANVSSRPQAKAGGTALLKEEQAGRCRALPAPSALGRSPTRCRAPPEGALLAHCQGLSAGKRGLCVPCLAPPMGTTGPFSQQGGHEETARSKAASLARSGHQEMLRVTPFSRCCLSPPASPGRRFLGRRRQQQGRVSRCTLGLTSSPSAPKPGGLFSLKRSFSLGTAVIVVRGSGGMVGSNQGDARPLGRRDLRQLLHPGAPSLGPALHPAGAESDGVVTSTVTGAVASTACPAAVRCLAFVQRAALIKIKGLFHYCGSPSNYAPAISCGSLQALQAALDWADVALQPSEPRVAAAPSLGRTGLLVALGRVQRGRGHPGATVLGFGAGPGVPNLGHPSGPPQPSTICTGTSGTAQARGGAGVTSPARLVWRRWETLQEVSSLGATGKLPN